MSRVDVDVVIPVFRHVEWTKACIESVLAHSGDLLGRLVLVDDASPEPQMSSLLNSFRADARVVVLRNAVNLGFVQSANLGLAICRGHVVMLNSDTQVGPDWLEELSQVLEASRHIAAVSPVSNNGGSGSVPELKGAVDPGLLEACASIPRWTQLPTGHGFCLLMRREVLDSIGQFDPAYGRGYNEENDWCQRAREHGYVIARANRVYVLHHGEASFQGERKRLDEFNSRRLLNRFPKYVRDNQTFEAGPEVGIVARAVRARLGGLRVRLSVESQVDLAVAKRLSESDEFRVEVTTQALAQACSEAGVALAGDEAPDVWCVPPKGAVPKTGAIVALLGDARLAEARFDPKRRAELWQWLMASQAIGVDGEEAKSRLALAFEGVVKRAIGVPPGIDASPLPPWPEKMPLGTVVQALDSSSASVALVAEACEVLNGRGAHQWASVTCIGQARHPWSLPLPRGDDFRLLRASTIGVDTQGDLKRVSQARADGAQVVTTSQASFHRLGVLRSTPCVMGLAQALSKATSAVNDEAATSQQLEPLGVEGRCEALRAVILKVASAPCAEALEAQAALCWARPL